MRLTYLEGITYAIYDPGHISVYAAGNIPRLSSGIQFQPTPCISYLIKPVLNFMLNYCCKVHIYTV